MSSKTVEDKQKDGFPFTARQKRRKLGSRKTRKQETGVLARRKKKEQKQR